jgi:tRNA pseudouridine13 synthase
MSDPLAPRSLPLLTPELPGTGGIIRLSEEDFRVEELPLYPASGLGDHLYVTIEKIGRNTNEVSEELAAALGAKGREVGVAGLKDKRAVATQRMSVPMPVGSSAQSEAGVALAAAFREKALAASGRGWRVLSAERHGNKLRTGHLAGNRFVVVIRGCSEDAHARAQAVLQKLAPLGLMNLFGHQRFGQRGDNAALGALILARDPRAGKASRDRFLRRFALSALQAELFNRCLSARVRDGFFAAALEGDVMKKRGAGHFVCTDPAGDVARMAAGEIDPAGPLPGHALFAAAGVALAREEAVLAEAAIDPRTFAIGGGEMEGARRPYRIPLGEVTLEPLAENALRLSFSLPPGSFAHALLREITKTGPDLDALPET